MPRIFTPANLARWRAHAWSLALFAALLQGLLPHAAMAGLLTGSDPALVWCAPALEGRTAVGDASPSAAAATHLPCICAASSEGALPLSQGGLAVLAPELRASDNNCPAARLAAPVRLPPACGPPV